MKKILVLDSIPQNLISGLEAKGFQLDFKEQVTEKDVLELPDLYYGIILRSKICIRKEIMDSKPGLKFIARLGSGMEHIDTAYAAEKNISCLSSPEGNANSVAEHSLGLLIGCLKHIPVKDAEVRAGIWNRSKGHEIYGKTIGIIGYGNTGKAFAKLLSGFGCRILVYDIALKGYGNERIIETDLKTLQQEADVISFHINYTPQNHYLANAAFFNACAKNPIILNTSRGQILSTEDLLNALKQEEITAAGLDVLEYESASLIIPKKEDWNMNLIALSALPNVILTPHIAGQTPEADLRHGEVILAKITSGERRDTVPLGLDIGDNVRKEIQTP